MGAKVKAPLAAAIACVFGLALVAALAYGSHSVQVLDAKALASFVAAPGSEGESAASAVRRLGNLPEMLGMLAIACAVGLACGRRRGVLAALIVVSGANLTTQMLKVLFSHPRVREILGADQLAWDGFPSGHVTAALSIAIAFAFVVPDRFRPLVAILGAWLVVGVAWAVLALDVHYPSDVIGAVFVAGAWGFGVLAGMRWTEATPRSAQSASPAAISVK